MHRSRHRLLLTPPHRGLLAYHEKDAERFFGRRELTYSAYPAYQDVHHGSAARLSAIIGPSGSGKSSFARAGLAARLRAIPFTTHPDAEIVAFTPSGNSLYQHGQAIAREALDN